MFCILHLQQTNKPEGATMNLFKKQFPERSLEPEENIFMSIALGIASVYALWLITGMLIAILS
jgi:hypothetical protein